MQKRIGQKKELNTNIKSTENRTVLAFRLQKNQVVVLQKNIQDLVGGLPLGLVFLVL